MTGDDYRSLDASGLAALVRRRDVSREEVLAAARGAIAAANPRINAVIAELDVPAGTSDRDEAPFAGVPFLLKDIGAALAGARTSCASRFFRDAPPEAIDDALTRRFKAAGLAILGKTNLPELGFNVTTEPVTFGPTRNPWNPDHSAGGSSGGSAAAVAAGMVPIAHATDGAGSIRIPAACCGLVGMKPSRGALPQGPAHADIYGGLVSEGVITRSVRDTAAALDATWGGDPGTPYAAPARAIALSETTGMPAPALRIGVMTACPDDVILAPDALAALDTAVRRLADLGHAVEPIVPDLGEAELLIPREVYLMQVCAQAATDAEELRRLFGRLPGEDEMERINLAAAEHGRRIAARDYLATTRRGHAFARRFDAVWERCDILLTPALASAAPRLGAFPTDHDDVAEHVARMLRFSPFTAIFNVTGEPAIVVPVTANAQGLPLGVQLAAPLGADARLLQVAAALEQALGRPAQGAPLPPAAAA